MGVDREEQAEIVAVTTKRLHGDDRGEEPESATARVGRDRKTQDTGIGGGSPTINPERRIAIALDRRAGKRAGRQRPHLGLQGEDVVGKLEVHGWGKRLGGVRAG